MVNISIKLNNGFANTNNMITTLNKPEELNDRMRFIVAVFIRTVCQNCMSDDEQFVHFLTNGF
jgi:hypothetical protein